MRGDLKKVLGSLLSILCRCWQWLVHCSLAHSRVFRDRLINLQDRTWYDNKMVEVLENEVDWELHWSIPILPLMPFVLQFCKAWAPESFVDVCWGDFLQSVLVSCPNVLIQILRLCCIQDTSPYVEINNMELAAAKLKEFSDDYTLNTNKPMELVFFKVSSML